ncbi:MAG: hypothetical protein DRP03_01030 [Candidatus Aenigmatarchaeota archaeon]|nr:MAG: hypothetical protein DRP03_01030 [Candidatus Aenigmarchaeota archaeon]
MKEHATREFYKYGKKARYFMLDELTLSHLLRDRNEFIEAGLPYGAAIARAVVKNNTDYVLEIGPGLGDLAIKFMEHAQGKVKHYVFLDISKDLIKHVKKRVNGMSVIGDAMLLPFKKGSIDLIICNEVLADLPIKRVNGKMINDGAIKAIRECIRLLRKNGKAVFIEVGGKAKRISVFGHEEYTIDFDEIERVLRKNNTRYERGKIAKLLGINTKLRFVSPVTQAELVELYKNSGMDKHKFSKIYSLEEFFTTFGNEKWLSKGYKQYLKKNARAIRELVEQFDYITIFKD